VSRAASKTGVIRNSRQHRGAGSFLRWLEVSQIGRPDDPSWRHSGDRPAQEIILTADGGRPAHCFSVR